MNKYEKLFGSGWARILNPFLEGDEFKKIGKYLKQQSDKGIRLYPLFDDMFKAFKECPYEKLNTVFLTNNAYGIEMDGMAFSITEPFLQHDQLTRIFDAVEEDVSDGLYLNRIGDLTRWANQGILLLNCDLSTEKGAKPGIHLDLWKPFMTYVLQALHSYNTGILYNLIGKEAIKYEKYINVEYNTVDKFEHPMLAVKENRAWKHDKIFSRINNALKFLNNNTIDWTIPYTKKDQNSFTNSGIKLKRI